jgi:rod shape determining protein RodA
VILLLYVEFFGSVGMGAQRWIDLGFMRLQPSELTKITLVMVLAAYYDWLDLDKTSRPVFVILPVVLISVPVFLTGAAPARPRHGAAAADGRRRGDVPRRACTGPISSA